ncbi:MAG: hypothetical protein FD119_2191 [Stygiobacter sp.]|nr:MAG: hypothetical protein FD119_2191 [Stygiobacter sp.]
MSVRDNGDTKEVLHAVTGLEWRREYDYLSRNIAEEWKAYPPGGGVLTISRIAGAENDTTGNDQWRWESCRAEDHPEGSRSEHHERPYVYLRGKGLATTVEAAAATAASYDFPSVEIGGAVWYRDDTQFNNGAEKRWIRPVAGSEVELEPAFNGDGWRWRHPVTAAKPLAELLDGANSWAPSICGQAPTFEAAAVAALAAPDIFRAAALQFLVSDSPSGLLASLNSSARPVEPIPTTTSSRRPRL